MERIGERFCIFSQSGVNGHGVILLCCFFCHILERAATPFIRFRVFLSLLSSVTKRPTVVSFLIKLFVSVERICMDIDLHRHRLDQGGFGQEEIDIHILFNTKFTTSRFANFVRDVGLGITPVASREINMSVHHIPRHFVLGSSNKPVHAHFFGA